MGRLEYTLLPSFPMSAPNLITDCTAKLMKIIDICKYFTKNKLKKNTTLLSQQCGVPI